MHEAKQLGKQVDILNKKQQRKDDTTSVLKHWSVETFKIHNFDQLISEGVERSVNIFIERCKAPSQKWFAIRHIVFEFVPGGERYAFTPVTLGYDRKKNLSWPNFNAWIEDKTLISNLKRIFGSERDMTVARTKYLNLIEGGTTFKDLV